MKNNIINLTANESFIAATVGIRRRISSIYKSKIGNYEREDVNINKRGWGTDVESAAAELAVGKYLNIYWDFSVNTGKAPDVGEFQVRQTELDYGSLIFRDGDNTNEKYILVVGSIPTFKIIGWIYGYSCKQDKYLKNPHNTTEAWFVPQSDLLSMDTISMIAK